MQYIEATGKDKPLFMSVFLAGGITGCPDWQSDMVRLISDFEVRHEAEFSVFNPRRKNFPISDPNASMEQIQWEFQRLRAADIVVFWFCKETLCPIVLWECSAALERLKSAATIGSDACQRLVIGCDYDYQRRRDVEIQSELLIPGQVVFLGWENFVNGTTTAMSKAKWLS